MKSGFMGVGLAVGFKMLVGGVARGRTGRVEMTNGCLVIAIIGIHLIL
jgi:hypothetical protein